MGCDGRDPVMRRGAWVLFLLLFVSSPVSAEDPDPLREDLRRNQQALEELRASRERLENASAQDPETLDRLKKEISLKSGELDTALQELGAQSPEEQLCFAVVRGDQEEVKRLLQGGADPNGKDRFSGSALEGAADGGFTEIVRLLIRKGADVNSRGKLGGTPLILAAAKGHLAVVRLLLESKADVNARADTGVTALTAAKGNRHKEVVELLKQAGAREQNVYRNR